jgi:adenylylsulfate kinase-like enzyme
MIYWFTGQPAAGKTVLGKKLHKFLQTEKRNWRKSVFHVDGDHLREIYQNKDYSEKGRRLNITNAQALVEYLHKCECDVVVSLVAPYLDLREYFKDKFGDNIVEIYVHTTQKRERDHFHVANYEPPQINFIDVDTTKDSPDNSFSKLINHLTKLNKL